MNRPTKIVYFGTADFAVPSLETLLKLPKDYLVITVISQPDRPAGRSAEIKTSKIAELARLKKLSLLQPEKFDQSTIEQIRKLSPDIFVVAAYGSILPQTILDIPKLGALNLHGSLLPKYRGASPIQTAIIEGETETGVTLMLMDNKMDHGPILALAKAPIEPTDDYISLSHKLSIAAANLLIENLPKYLNQSLLAEEQNHRAATFTHILKKEDGRIDWKLKAIEIEHRLHGLSPWPGLFTKYSNNEKSGFLKIHDLQITDSITSSTSPGTIQKTKDGYPIIAAADKWIKLLTVQPEGKKQMTGNDFLRGYPNITFS